MQCMLHSNYPAGKLRGCNNIDQLRMHYLPNGMAKSKHAVVRKKQVINAYSKRQMRRTVRRHYFVSPTTTYVPKARHNASTIRPNRSSKQNADNHSEEQTSSAYIEGSIEVQRKQFHTSSSSSVTLITDSIGSFSPSCSVSLCHRKAAGNRIGNGNYRSGCCHSTPVQCSTTKHRLLREHFGNIQPVVSFFVCA